MVKESPEPRRGNYLEPLGFGGNPESSGDGEFPGHPARGSPEPAGDLGDWNTGEVAGPGRWSSGAKDAEKSAGRRREAGEAAASHTCSGLVLLCPKGPNRARTDTPPRPRPFRPAARSRPGSAVVVQFERVDVAGRSADRDRPRWPVAGRRGFQPPVQAVASTGQAQRQLACRPEWHKSSCPERAMALSVAVRPPWAGQRQARPPATPRRPAGLPAGTPGTRARGR